MQTYDDLVHLARVCIRQAKATDRDEVAAELIRMADEYRQRAAALDGGRLPQIEDE